ncbi:hypothetical protein VKT23_010818 [Stygiomarasmius scandens]|uniref:Uncharacterized protein n=1 Tax=Marasmiellus scandens TaxID=2682957 RepID=A0ABR1JAC0_9AGAR
MPGSRHPDAIGKFNDVKVDPCSLVSQLTWRNVTCRGCGNKIGQDSDKRDFVNWAAHRAGCAALRTDPTTWVYPPGQS